MHVLEREYCIIIFSFAVNKLAIKVYLCIIFIKGVPGSVRYPASAKMAIGLCLTTRSLCFAISRIRPTDYNIARSPSTTFDETKFELERNKDIVTCEATSIKIRKY